MTNPLLDFSDLPLFDRIRPAHVAPAVDALLAQADAALEQVTAPAFPADWRAIAKVLDVATERLGRAWGAVGHLNAVADTPPLRAAYNEAMPRVTAFWTRLGSDERLYAKYKSIDPGTLDTEQRQAHKNAMRRLRARRRRTAGRGQEALCRDPGTTGRTGTEVQRERAGCDRRLRLVRGLRGTRRRTAGRGGRGPRRGPGRGQGRLQAHAEDALLLAGDAVRQERRAARAAVPRLCHPRQRVRRRGARQHAADPRDPGAAPGRSQAARPPQLRRTVAGAQDGRVAGPGGAVPARTGRQGAALCRARPGRPACLRGRPAGHRRSATLGLELRRRKAQGGALRLQRAGGQAVLHRAQGDGRTVQDRRDAVRSQHPARQRAGVASGRRVLPHRARRPNWSASSISTPRRAPPSAVAPGWTTCARAGCARTTAACRRRSRTWCATSPRASTASRRC